MKGCNLVLIRPFVVNLALVGDHLVVVVVVVGGLCSMVVLGTE